MCADQYGDRLSHSRSPRSPYLTIRGDAEVDSIVIEGKRAVGVRLVN